MESVSEAGEGAEVFEQEVGGHLDGEVRLIEAPSQGENPYGVGHGGPSGKEAAQERFAKAQAQAQAKTAS